MALFPDSIPADTDPVALGASVIRALKTALNTIFGAYFNDDGSWKNNVIPGSALEDGTVTQGKLDPGAVANIQVPVGGVIEFAGTVLPANYLWCDGASYLRGSSPSDTYFNLFSQIGTSFGSVDGTHFNVPDSRGRVTVMPDGGAARTPTISVVGSTDGSATHTLITSEIPSHTHNADDTGLDSLVVAGGGSGGNNGSGSNNNWGFKSHTGTTGGDGAHNNLQPSLGMNKIIRYV